MFCDKVYLIHLKACYEHNIHVMSKSTSDHLEDKKAAQSS